MLTGSPGAPSLIADQQVSKFQSVVRIRYWGLDHTTEMPEIKTELSNPSFQVFEFEGCKTHIQSQEHQKEMAEGVL